MAKCIDEPLNHGKRMSNGQTFDVHGSGARAKPKHYQLVPSSYRGGKSWVKGKRGYGLAVGRRESILWGSYSDSFKVDALL